MAAVNASSMQSELSKVGLLSPIGLSAEQIREQLRGLRRKPEADVSSIDALLGVFETVGKGWIASPRKLARLHYRAGDGTNVGYNQAGASIRKHNPTGRGFVDPTRIHAQVKHPVVEAPPVLEWAAVKSKRPVNEPSAFVPGDRVRITGMVDEVDGEYRLRVEGNGLWPDNFYLGRDPKLAELLGTAITAVVEVGAERLTKGVVTDIASYDGTLQTHSPAASVNPSAAVLAELRPKTRVIIEGELVEVMKYPKQDVVGFDFLTIKTADGRLIPVNLPQTFIDFSGGALENLRHKQPMPGDRIRIAAYVLDGRPDDAMRCGADRNASCVLLVPSVERAEAERVRRSQVVERVAAIELAIKAGDFKTARRGLAELRKDELTRDEVDATYALAKRIPKGERPALILRECCATYSRPSSYVREIDSAYGVMLESMTTLEVYRFLRAAVSGAIEQSGPKTNVSRLFGVAKDLDLTPADCDALVFHCLDARLARVRSAPAGSKAAKDHGDAIEEAIRSIGAHQTPANTQRLCDLFVELVERGEFDHPGAPQPKPESFLAEIMRSLDWFPDEATLAANRNRLESATLVLKEQSDDLVTVRLMGDVLAGRSQYRGQRS